MSTPIRQRAQSWTRRLFHKPTAIALLAICWYPAYASSEDGFTQPLSAGADVHFTPRFSAFVQIVPQSLPMTNLPYSITTVGAHYDPGPWSLMAEWRRTSASAPIPEASAWYVTVRHRIDGFTPFLTLAKAQIDNVSGTGNPAVGLPFGLAETAAALDGGRGAVINGFAWAQRDVSAGVRWDLMRNTALKLQYDYLTLDSDTGARLISVQPASQTGGHVSLFSIAVDLVF
jgi:hypothetical protein